MELLNSIAAFVAITAALWSWFRSAQKPLKLVRIVLHKKKESSTYILLIKNRKPYPVTIKNTSCYKKRSYRIQQKTGGEPEYHPILDLAFQVFDNRDQIEIEANAHTDIKFETSKTKENPNKLMFSLQTSHGYHELWCKNILSVDMSGQGDTYSLIHNFEYHEKYKALAKYSLLRLKWLIKKSNNLINPRK